MTTFPVNITQSGLLEIPFFSDFSNNSLNALDSRYAFYGFHTAAALGQSFSTIHFFTIDAMRALMVLYRFDLVFILNIRNNLRRYTHMRQRVQRVSEAPLTTVVICTNLAEISKNIRTLDQYTPHHPCAAHHIRPSAFTGNLQRASPQQH